MTFKKYDIFISYAIEDKTTVAGPLAELLKKNGLKVFFAGTELGIGDDIREVIHNGLRQSKFGVVILSPDYNRSWTFGELFNLIDKEVFERQAVIYPVWHHIRFSEIKSHFPDLVNRYALPTDKGLEFIASEITRQVKRKVGKKRKRILIRTSWIVALMFCSSLLVPGVQQVKRNKLPDRSVFKSSIMQRIEKYQVKIRTELMKTNSSNNGELVSPERLFSKYRQYLSIGTGGKHLYSFRDDRTRLNSLKAIEEAGIFPDDGPFSYYDVSRPAAYRVRDIERKRDTLLLAEYILIDKDPLKFVIDTITRDEQQHIHVFVSYAHNIRAAQVKYLIRRSRSKTQQEQKINLFGFKPREEYVFEHKTGIWSILEIK